MTDFSDALQTALLLLVNLDAGLIEIIALSLRVSLTAVAVAALVGLPLGALLAVSRFPTRRFWINLLNTFMGLPPVVVGLMVYLLLSRAGPLGPLGLLYTPVAMIIAQTLLILPIIAALSCGVVQGLFDEYHEQLRSLGSRTLATARTLLWEGRFGLVTAILAGFGRGNAEVGAVLIVGGNINHSTRVMTTTIALETSKGNLALALALGLILILVSLLVASAAQWLHTATMRRSRS
ncbi:MAG: ABC transporter permease [Gammaproteobacteria bacterium]|nr:ABC transporter permease [Gammaproteobacteria bacterium]MDD9807060.1 ABC transporter permease [Gammaproteobacteria bacterium]MDD9868896.1 ABC transporter permease [Gammaproteobacteria bacterium]MDD9886261.1 ABC transporter permease [Gammaproteobacteria bacterium]